LPDFFISYAREDGQFVDRPRAALTAREREVWVDREALARRRGGSFAGSERAQYLKR